MCFVQGALLVGTEGNQIVKIPLGDAQAEVVGAGGEEGGAEEDEEGVAAVLASRLSSPSISLSLCPPPLSHLPPPPLSFSRSP